MTLYGDLTLIQVSIVTLAWISTQVSIWLGQEPRWEHLENEVEGDEG